MGHYARLSADRISPAGNEAEQRTQNAPAWNMGPGAPASGCGLHNEKPVTFVLEASSATPDAYRVMPEHMIMAALVVMSFLAPVFHLLG